MSTRFPISLVLAGFWWFILVGASQSFNGAYETSLVEAGRIAESQKGWLVSSFFAGSTAMILLSGWLTQRIARLLLIWIVAATFTVGAALAAMSSNYLALCAGAALMGCGYGGLTVTFNAEFSLAFPGARTTAWLSALNGFWGVGAVIGPKVFGHYVKTPNFTHILLAIGGLIGLAILSSVRHLQPHAHSANDRDPRRGTLGPAVWLIAAAMAFYVGTEVTVGSRMADFLVDQRGLTLPEATGLTSLMWLTFTTSRFAIGPVTKWLSAPTLVLVSTGACAVAVGLLAIGQTHIGFMVLGVAMAPIFPALLGWSTQVAPNPHQASAAVIAAASLSAVVLPQAASIVLNAKLMPFHALLWTGLAALAVGIIVAQRVARRTLVSTKA